VSTSPYVLLPSGSLDDRAAGDAVGLPDATVHHLGRVLKRRDGSHLEVADGAGAHAGGHLDGATVVLEGPVRHTSPPTPTVTAWQAIGKGRKHDEVVRTLTELGVDRVIAVRSDRTVPDLSSKAPQIRARWEAVATSACEQARRPRLPELGGPVALEDLLAGLSAPCLVAHVGDTTDPLAAAASAVVDAEDVIVAVGPEGGWTDAEIDAFTSAGAVTVGLGPTVLRTEHAAAVLAGIVLAVAGRMGRQG
jgi:16S rRNA (uracil1498-N3)-methyltransferase